MEKKIIEAKFIPKNIYAIYSGISGLLLIILSIVMTYLDYLTENSYYYAPNNFSEYFMDTLMLSVFNYWGCHGGYFFYLGCILIIVFFVLFFMMKNCAFSIYTTYVTGKASFGKQVHLPLNQISAVGLTSCKGLTVSTSSGHIHFWLIENRELVYNALNELLSNLQTDSNKRMTPTIAADELKKYKELLDNGVITQEEFDAKKKQLLGL